MDTLIEPNLHPILVHFVVGLLFTGAIVQAVTAFSPSGARWRSALQAAGDWMLALGLVAAVAAVLAGFEAYYSVDHDAASHAAMTTHRNWALAAASTFLALGVWRFVQRKQAPGALFAVASLAAAALLTVTAWWGGTVVFQHGVGVERLPEVSGDGHDHDHGDDGHGAGESETDSAPAEEAGHAHEDGHQDDGHHQAATEGAATPEAAAGAFHQALSEGDAQRVRALLDPGVLILESGGVERSLEEYASGHMNSDMAFMQAVSSQRLSRHSRTSADMAWVATETALRGTYNDRDIAVKSQETLVLQRADGQWRIVHVHWSNSPLPADAAPAAEGDEDEGEPDGHDHGDHEH